MLVVFFRAVILYILVTLCLRLMGKRQLGELQPAEFVITILISNIASLPIEDTNIPMVLGLIPVFVLVAFEVIVSTLSLSSKRFRSIMSGKPVIVIYNGQIDQEKLKQLRFSIDDLMESLRQQGVFRVQDVWYAIVETTGKVSVMQRFEARTVTPADLSLSGGQEQPPAVVVSDGQIIRSALPICNMTEEQVKCEARKKGVSISQVFLMTATPDGQIYLVKKQKGRAAS